MIEMGTLITTGIARADNMFISDAIVFPVSDAKFGNLPAYLLKLT